MTSPGSQTLRRLHGRRIRKKLFGGLAVVGIAFEKPPEESKVPELFVVQLLIGADRLVVVSQV